MVEVREPIAIALPRAEGEAVSLRETELAAQVVLRKPRRARDVDGGDFRSGFPRALARPGAADRFVPELVRPAVVVEDQDAPRQSVRARVARDPRRARVRQVL